MRAEGCLAVLERRLAALPRHLGEALAAVEEELPAAPGRVWVTGGGMSEGPARLLAALLTELGHCAEVVPLSEFAAPALERPGDTLVLFSQGLAPNARFPLVHLGAFRHRVIVTSVRPDPEAPAGDARRLLAEAARQGARVVVLPPEDESGMLLRVVGPAIAGLAAALLCQGLARAAGRGDWREVLAGVAGIYEEALAGRPEPLLVGGEAAPIALVASGRYANACYGLRWKLLEGLLVADPPIWDALQVAHGPLPSFYERRQVIVALERAGAAHEGPLLDRLGEALVPERHRLVRLPSGLPGALAWFEHDARLDALLVATLRARPVDLCDWPGRGRDGVLYGIAPPEPLPE